MINKRKCPIHRFSTLTRWKDGLLQCTKCGGYIEPVDGLEGVVSVRRTPKVVEYEII